MHNLLHRQRHFFRRLNDVGIAAGDRVGHEPERDHSWKVEGAMTAATPSGWRIMNSSMPLAMSSEL